MDCTMLCFAIKEVSSPLILFRGANVTFYRYLFSFRLLLQWVDIQYGAGNLNENILFVMVF